MKKITVSLVALALAFSMTGCGKDAKKSDQTTNQPKASSSFKAEVKSCNETLTFDKAPERILMLSETDAPILYELGLLDKVVARAGNDRIDTSRAELRAAIDKIPTLKAGDTGTGGAKVSTEAALSVNPDLVIGYDEGADRDQLRKAGVKLYSPDAMCAGWTTDKASFDLVKQEVTKISTIFGVSEKGVTLNKKIDDQVKSLSTNAKKCANTQKCVETAAALFVMPDSTTFYSYGTSSMVQPIFELNGLHNVYDTKKERVFEASMEDLLAKDPDWIVLMSDKPDAEAAKKIFAGFPGANKMKAYKNNQIIFLPFILTDPPTTLSVEGAVELGKLTKK